MSRTPWEPPAGVFPPGYKPPLEPPTTYRATTADRVGDWAAAAGAAAFASFVVGTAAIAPRTLTGLEWIFVGLLAVTLLLFAGHRALHARKADRILVTADGFVRIDMFGQRRVAWRDVVGMAYAGEISGTARVKVILRTESGPDEILVELSGLTPPGLEFTRQLYRLAPAALHYESSGARFLRKLGLQPRPARIPSPTAASPAELPDFTRMRAEAHAILEGKDLVDALQNLDELERAWNGRIDPSVQPQGKP